MGMRGARTGKGHKQKFKCKGQSFLEVFDFSKCQSGSHPEKQKVITDAKTKHRRSQSAEDQVC